MIQAALSEPIVTYYVRGLALLLAFGALVHVGNVLGLSGRPWLETPVLWRAMDVVLLLFNVVVGIGLWAKTSWAVISFVGGIVLLQIVPYTLFKRHFIETTEHTTTLEGMVVFWVVILVLLAGLLIWKGRASQRG
jgi:hypothetical protein